MEGFQKKTKDKPLFKFALEARKEERYDEYVSILKEGLDQDDPDCIYLLAQCYYDGYYGIKEDVDESFKLIKKNDNHYKSMITVGYMLIYNGFANECEINLNELATKILNSSGNHFAKGFCFYYGIGTDFDNKKAFEEFLLSTEEGDDEGELKIGHYFEYGKGIINKDKLKAFEWYLKSAEQGNIDGIYCVARSFYYGEGISKNYEQSLYWYKKFYKATGNPQNVTIHMNLNEEQLNQLHINLDSLIHLHLAKCYLKGQYVNEKNEYLSWYFFKKTKEKEGKQQLKELEETNLVFKGISKCYKMVITLLCIGKASVHPKEVFMLIAKELWKTRLNIKWTNK